jgi:hypothetical protein
MEWASGECDMLGRRGDEETEQEDSFTGVIWVRNLCPDEENYSRIVIPRTCSTRSPLQTTTVLFRSSG